MEEEHTLLSVRKPKSSNNVACLRYTVVALVFLLIICLATIVGKMFRTQLHVITLYHTTYDMREMWSTLPCTDPMTVVYMYCDVYTMRCIHNACNSQLPSHPTIHALHVCAVATVQSKQCFVVAMPLSKSKYLLF